MRIWSVHPRHLDPRGLVTLWREGLLARAVLLGKTRGYRQHPQLDRWKATRDPVAAIEAYLSRILDEAGQRGYAFDATKIAYRRRGIARLTVTRGQLNFEWQHLMGKLMVRARDRWNEQRRQKPTPHDSFRVVSGPIAGWEKSVRKSR
jgi:hypothetical protein